MPRARPPETQDKKIEALTVRFPDDVLQAMRDCAAQEERALNTVIVRACREYAEIDPRPDSKKGGRRG